MESEDWYVGLGSTMILIDKYGTTGFGTPTVEYKTAATQGALSGVGYSPYSGAFQSLGWIKIRVSA